MDVELGWAKFTFGATYVGEQGILYKGRIGRPAPGEPDHGADTKFGVFYHRFGTPQEQDILVWHAPHEFRFFGRPQVIGGNVREGSGRRAWLYLDLFKSTNPESECLLVELPGGTKRDSLTEVGQVLPELVMERRRWLTNNFTGTLRCTHASAKGTTLISDIGTLPDDRILFVSTTDGVAAGRVVAYDAADHDTSQPGDLLPAIEIVPPDPEGHQLCSANLASESVLVLVYLRHACAAVVFVDARTGKPIGKTDPKGSTRHVVADGPINLNVPDQQLRSDAKPPIMIPKHASISTVTSRDDADDFYMAVDTYISTPYVVAGRINKGANGVEVEVHGLGSEANKTEDLVCRQVFYESFDGTRVPLFIAHAADLDTTVPQPTLLYAYGGFSHPVLPHFDPFFTAFMRNLRGV